LGLLKNKTDVGEARPVDETEVDVVWVVMTGVDGLRRGADDEDDDNPRRAKSILKLDSLERGGSGEEVFRARV
jgi:hypothetical protein